MERIVGETLPQLAANRDGLTKIMQQIALNYKKKEEEVDAYQKQYNIKIKA